MSKDRSVYLLHALDCIERIERYTIEGEAKFLEDSLLQDAVIRNIEVIGQCVKDFGIEDLEKDRPDIPWQQIAGMRNKLAHEYLGVDISLTWGVVSEHITPLKSAISASLKHLQNKKNDGCTPS